MIRRVNQQQKHGAPPADLLVCFPSRAHLTLIPKKINSPARLMDHSFHHHQRNNQLKKLPSTRLASHSWDKTNKATTSSDDVSEPTSPKVTCAGQIKVRPSRSSAAANCKSWQSFMEEIERIHKKSKIEKKKKKASWGDALGIKKDVIQFSTCLRNLKLDFRCFGAVPECDLSSDEDDEEDDDDQEASADGYKKNINQSESDNRKEEEEEDTITSEKDCRTVFSDWFMVVKDVETEKDEAEAPSTAPPPPNSLLLMRCRSAPAKSWMENRAKMIVEEEDEEKTDHNETHTQHQQQQEEEESEKEGKKKLRDYLLVMEQYDTEFYKLSNDIAKETWVVGSIKPFSRSRSWKR